MTTHSGPVVVGIDGSASALAAVRWAAAVARREHVALRLVHAHERPVGLPAGVAEEESLLNALQEQGRRWLAEAPEVATEDAAEVAAGVYVDTPTELVLAAAPTVRALLHESDDASMVVLGTRGLSALTGLLVGCTSVAIAGQAFCPVVVVRGAAPDQPPRTTGPVVVGVDGTEVSEAAIGFAFEASARGADLYAVHTWTESLFAGVLPGNKTTVDLTALREQAEETLAERLAGWQERYPNVRVHREVVHDRPGRALRRCATTARLVVVGRRNRTAFGSLLLGSTSQDLLQHGQCPVAVVRAQDPAGPVGG